MELKILKVERVMVEVVRSFFNSLNLLIVLWLLSAKPRHGYEIMKEFKRLTGTSLNPGVIYPLLHYLEKEGLAISKWVKEKNKAKRHYRLTAKGRNLFYRLRRLFREQLRVFTEFLIVNSEH